MNRFLFLLGIAACLSTAATPCAGGVIWDYSPATTGSSGPHWANNESFQNFAELVSFAVPVKVTGMDVYSVTTAGTVVGDDVHVRFRSDASGLPGPVLFDFIETISVIDAVGATTGNNRKHVDFTIPVSLAAGTPYWVGMSGDGVDIAQMGLTTNPPADSQMAQFKKLDFAKFTGPGGGDMAFRLIGQVPEPSGVVLFATTAACLLGYCRRRKQKNALQK